MKNYKTKIYILRCDYYNRHTYLNTSIGVIWEWQEGSTALSDI